MKLDFAFQTISKRADETALIDSGATENFIDIEVWKMLKIGRFRLEKTIPVHNVDGSINKNGNIDSYVWLKVRLGKQEKNMKFYLTSIGKERFILGYPFLETFNPEIDWKNSNIGGRVEIETLSFRKAQNRVRRIQKQALEKYGKPPKGQALYIRKVTKSQQWAQEARKDKKTEREVTLPNRYIRYKDIFDEKKAERFPPIREEDMKIEFKPGAPAVINCKVYPLNKKETDVLREFLNEEERKGYIKAGSLQYTSPVFFVGKKDSQELRPVMDYREVNKWTVRNNNPLPNINTALENLQGGKLFSKFDLRWGYKNIRIRPEDRHKAAFKTTFGVYIPNVTYFGLTNTPPAFQRAMQRDLRPLMQKYPKEFGNYLDDIWIVTRNDEQQTKLHQQITEKLLGTLKQKSYFLKLSKSVFEAAEIDLLGWRIKNRAVQIDPDKIAGLAKWPTELKSEGDVRSTMGLIGYHRRHIRGFAHIAQPILETIKKKNMEEGFKWTPECTGALKELIRRVTSDPILKCPDPSHPFELVVDASAFAIGAILQQRDDQGKIYDVGYYSKALNKTERNYDIWDREFMAVIFGLRNWRHLLSGSPHKVICWTDHANLQYYRHPQKINRRVARYISTLAEYDLELKHLPGIKNRADPLSR